MDTGNCHTIWRALPVPPLPAVQLVLFKNIYSLVDLPFGLSCTTFIIKNLISTEIQVKFCIMKGARASALSMNCVTESLLSLVRIPDCHIGTRESWESSITCISVSRTATYIRARSIRMPRRRIAKGRESGSKSKSKSFHKSDGKLKKWNTISDIPMDEEDQCASLNFLFLLTTFKKII